MQRSAMPGSRCRLTRWVLSALFTCAFSRCLPAQAGHTVDGKLGPFVFTHPAMATTFSLYLYAGDAAKAATVAEEVFDEVDRIEQLLSNYRVSSELSRINRDAAKDTITVDPEMMEFLTQSARWSAASDGAFDITVGRLMKAWGFYTHAGEIPEPSKLARLRLSTGWQKVQLDPVQRTVHFTSPGVELDPGGIGKGFAVDAAVRVLRADGIRAALLSAGSSTIYGLGAPAHRRGWRVVIPGPLPSRKVLSFVLLRDESLSSADCSQKHFLFNGHSYCHIMDPRTLRPVEGRIQVSVIDPSATASDALSNVLFVERPEQSRNILARSEPMARGLIVSRKGRGAVCEAIDWKAFIDSRRCPLTRSGPNSIQGRRMHYHAPRRTVP